MRSIKATLFAAVFCCFLPAAFARAATITGTVTDKTTNKPSGGDKVELVDVQAGMSVAATAMTDAGGHYTLNKPGAGPYLVRVNHQGGSYFIAAPEGNGPGDIPVYDVAADINGVSIEADVIEMETDNGVLRITERYFVHNTSNPPRTQYNPSRGFGIVLPPGAVVDGAAARRPTGLPTSTALKPAGGKDHFQFDFPIQPDEGDKDTLFQLSYHLPYDGKATFRPQVEIPADNVAVLLPKGITFNGSGFQPIQQDPGIQTFLAKNVTPGPGLEFAISGSGSMPREQQGAQGQQPAPDSGSQDAGNPGNRPGGGIGEPINTPDPLTKYKWWILGGLGLLLAAAAGFLLRKPAGGPAAAPASGDAAAPLVPTQVHSSPGAAAPPPVSPAGVHSYLHTPNAAPHSNASLLNVLKEELFALESERLSNTISAADYAEQKAALETVLKRALSRK
ncbi:MAG TPA: carboxypeptidase-like regulatory domain-containing protein [Candidatus Sulfopaludibacter sp.]|jgi:hypothetical protein|nr:carboxypeptidase-like regulatory domain-containing protein [Candidatus Sulfopaludibacter sp.]